tara:strand:+ start:137 stop:634 length:498 start_codon:yes stop_codon:yes gene_type:complete
MSQIKKNRWSDEAKWEGFILPLNNWLEDLVPETEDIQDMVDITLMQIKRGRNAENRPKIVKQLKIDFAEQDFEGWSIERLDKNIVKKMNRMAKANRKVHLAFFNDSNTVQTFTKDGVKYMHVEANTYADAKHKSDVSTFKALQKDGLDWENPVYAVMVDADGEEE